MNNLKDNLTTICGIIAAICSVLITTHIGGLNLPTWLITTCSVLSAISLAIIGFLTGKNPNGTTKTSVQISNDNGQ